MHSKTIEKSKTSYLGLLSAFVLLLSVATAYADSQHVGTVEFGKKGDYIFIPHPPEGKPPPKVTNLKKVEKKKVAGGWTVTCTEAGGSCDVDFWQKD